MVVALNCIRSDVAEDEEGDEIDDEGLVDAVEDVDPEATCGLSFIGLQAMSEQAHIVRVYSKP